MSAPVDEVRIRLIIPNSWRIHEMRSEESRCMCWFLVDKKLLHTIGSLEEEIQRRFKNGSGQHGDITLWLENCLLPTWEKIGVLRENDTVTIRCDARQEPDNHVQLDVSISAEKETPETNDIYRGKKRKHALPHVNESEGPEEVEDCSHHKKKKKSSSKTFNIEPIHATATEELEVVEKAVEESIHNYNSTDSATSHKKAKKKKKSKDKIDISANEDRISRQRSKKKKHKNKKDNRTRESDDNADTVETNKQLNCEKQKASLSTENKNRSTDTTLPVSDNKVNNDGSKRETAPSECDSAGNIPYLSVSKLRNDTGSPGQSTTVDTDAPKKKTRRRNRKKKKQDANKIDESGTSSVKNLKKPVTSVLHERPTITKQQLPPRNAPRQNGQHFHFGSDNEQDDVGADQEQGISAQNVGGDGEVTIALDQGKAGPSPSWVQTRGSTPIGPCYEKYMETPNISPVFTGQIASKARPGEVMESGARIFKRNRLKKTGFYPLSKEEQLNTLATNRSIVLQNSGSALGDSANVSPGCPQTPAGQTLAVRLLRLATEKGPHEEAAQEKDDLENHVQIVNGDRDSGREEKVAAKDYSSFAVLVGPPRPGDKIAFKIIELSDSYTPEVSAYKEGKVLSCDAGLSQEVEIQLVVPQRKQREGKFELNTSEEGTSGNYEETDQLKAKWPALLEPRLIP